MRGTKIVTIINRYWKLIMWNRADNILVRMDTKLAVVRNVKQPYYEYDIWRTEWKPVHWADPWLNSTDRTD